MVLYKEFRVGDLFDIKGSKKAINKNMIDNFKGRYPYVTRTEKNNGISDYIDYDEKYLNEGNTITLGMDTYVINYQEKPYFTGSRVKVVKYNAINKDNARYIVTALKKLFVGYSWGMTLNQKQIDNLLIELPVKSLEDTEPDWEYMKEYIKQKELAYIGKLNQEFEQKKEQLIELIGEESEYINIEELPTAKFKVKDLYDNIYRGKRITKNDRVKGDIPLVTAGKEDLGISEYIKGHTTQGVNNTITIDMFGNVFYRDYLYYMDDNIIVLHNEEISKENNLYIASTLNYLKEEYSYASQFRMKSLESVKIELPINPELSDLVPDWETMEDYINGIKHLYLHKEESNHKEKLELLFELTGWSEQDLDNIENLGVELY